MKLTIFWDVQLRGRNLKTQSSFLRLGLPSTLIGHENSRGAYLSTKNFDIFRNGDKWYRNFLSRVPENPEIVGFAKNQPFNRKFRKFQGESQMERKFPWKKVRKFGYTSRGCPLFRNLCKFPIFYSALASSFGRDHSELDISRKDDGDTHSIKETL